MQSTVEFTSESYYRVIEPHHFSFVRDIHVWSFSEMCDIQMVVNFEQFWIIPNFFEFGVICCCMLDVITNIGQHQWLIHPYSFLNYSLGHIGKKYYQKILSLCLHMSCKIWLFQVVFHIFNLILIISSYFLLVGLLLQYGIWGSVSVQGVA